MLSLTKLQSASGLLLVAAAAAGLAVANSPLSDEYDALFATRLTVSFGEAALSKPLLAWIDDGLMAVFFLLVALELKQAVVEGDLADRRKAVLPLFGAIGGMVVPALVYTAFNYGDPVAMEGWAIPAATDIAFALGVLALVGDRVPKSLKTFLLSVAVFDDLGAILVIAIFYTGKMSWAMHGLAAVTIGLLVALNRGGVKALGPYVFLGILLWLFVLKSGVHATLAGVALGFTIPLRTPSGASPARRIEHALYPYVAVGVVPLFAFANSGVDLRGLSTGELLDPIALGIAAGLVVGKPLGVGGATWLAVRLGLAERSADWSRTAFAGIVVLAGIGFTMSLFIGALAFEEAAPGHSAAVRLGVLGGSLFAASLGFALVRIGVRRAVPELPR